MKNKLLLFTFAVMATSLFLMSNSAGRATSGNGDSSGAPGAATCAQCHSGGSFSSSVSAEVMEEGTTTLVSEYEPGKVYDIKVKITATGASGFGMQTTALDGSDGPVVGFSAPSSNAQLITLSSGRQFFEHASTNSNEFTAKWTAPAAGAGSVTFYTAGNSINENGSTGGDEASASTLVLTEGTSSSSQNLNQLEVAMKVFPNPVQSTLNIETIGSTDGQHNLTITNMIGQTVHQSIVNLDLGMDITKVDVQDLPKGMYNVSLAKEGKMKTIMIVKQ
ncbi:MAG: choice-of-anchor V domain-containing protein [Saprospiraceae bacterium]